MKRGKAFWVPVGLAGFLVLLIAMLTLISQQNRTAMLQAPPLTVAEVTRLAAPNGANISMSPNSAATAVSTPTEYPHDISPPPLARAVTPEEALDRLGRVATWQHRSQARLKLILADELSTACGVAGIEGEQGGWYWEAGQEAEKLGNADLAKGLLPRGAESPHLRLCAGVVPVAPGLVRGRPCSSRRPPGSLLCVQ